MIEKHKLQAKGIKDKTQQQICIFYFIYFFIYFIIFIKSKQDQNKSLMIKCTL